MLDIRLLREQPDLSKERLAQVGCEAAEVQAVLDVDKRRRELIASVESMRAERKQASKRIGAMKGAPEAEAAKAEVRALGEKMVAAEKNLSEVEDDFRARMLRLPNLPHPDVPPGPDESANIMLRSEDETRTFDFEPKPHLELG